MKDKEDIVILRRVEGSEYTEFDNKDIRAGFEAGSKTLNRSFDAKLKYDDTLIVVRCHEHHLSRGYAFSVFSDKPRIKAYIPQLYGLNKDQFAIKHKDCMQQLGDIFQFLNPHAFQERNYILNTNTGLFDFGGLSADPLISIQAEFKPSIMCVNSPADDCFNIVARVRDAQNNKIFDALVKIELKQVKENDSYKTLYAEFASDNKFDKEQLNNIMCDIVKDLRFFDMESYYELKTPAFRGSGPMIIDAKKVEPQKLHSMIEDSIEQSPKSSLDNACVTAEKGQNLFSFR